MDSNDEDARRGARDAEGAWDRQEGALLARDRLYATAPIVTDTGLPLRVTLRSAEYAHAWNERTSQLLAANGMPAWAPGARIPPEDALAAAVAQAVPPAEFPFATPRERSYLRRSFLRYRPDDEVAVTVGRLDAHTVLLASSLGYVDLIDTTRERWFARIHPPS